MRPFRRRARTALVTTVALLLTAGTSALSALPAEAVVSTCTSAGLALTTLHGPRFYIDSGVTPKLLGAYAGYAVTNSTGSTKTDLWVKLTNFGGGVVALGSGQAASQQVPSLANTAAASRFWYLTATAASTTAQTHDVEVWQGRPDLTGSTRLCLQTNPGGFTSVDETIQANSSSLDSVSVSVSGGTPRLGATFTVTATGSTGTIGNGTTDDPQSFWMSPAAAANWPADAYRLVGTSLTLGGTTYTDRLRVANAGSSNKSYTAQYTFRAIGFTSSSTSVLPVQQIASGTQIKHTPTSPMSGSLPAITPATNDITLAKTADAASLPPSGGTVHYTVSLAGASGAVVDSFEDTVPSGATYVAGSATWRGATISPAPVLTGSVLSFSGPFTMGSSPNKLEYSLVLPSTPGDRSNSVVAKVGSATLDSTLSTSDSSPPAAVVHVDAAPVAHADTASVTQQVATDVDVLANDTDADGDALTVTAVGAPSHGNASTDGTKVTYTSAAGYTGSDSFSYTVSDANGGTSTGTVSVTVNAPAPVVATDDTAAATSGVAVDVDVVANDTGNPPLVVTDPGAATHGTVSVVGNKVRYTPDAAYTGSDTFTYTVTDALSNTQTATVGVTVDPPALVAGNDSGTTDDASPATIPVLGNDSGFGTLTATLDGQPTHGTVVDNGDGTLGFTPEAGWTGTATFTYTLTDGLGRTTTGTVSVTVGPRAIAVADDTASTDDATPATVSPLLNDSGFGALAVTAVTQPAHGSVADNGDGTLTFTPTAGWAGATTFTYTATDGAAQHADGTVTVTVAPRALTALDDTASTDDETGVDVPVLGNDGGFGTLAVTAVTQPAHGTVTDNGDGTVRFTPQDDWQGTASFTYTVTDDAPATATATVDVTVSPAAFAAADDTATTQDTAPVTVHVLTNDDGFGALAVTGVTQPAHGTVTDNGDGTVTFTPETGELGDQTFTYTGEDSLGSSATGIVTVTVTGPPPAPSDDTDTTDDATARTLHVLDNDSGTGTLTITAVTQPAHGTVTDNGDGTLELVPEDGWTGTATFTYTVSDSLGGSATATVSVTVSPRALVATDDTGTTDDVTATDVDVLTNDDGFRSLTVDSVTQPAHGTVTDNGDGTLHFVPDAGVVGAQTFSYTVSDEASQTGTATVTVDVTDSGSGGGGGSPDPVDDTATVAWDDTEGVLVDVVANDPDGAVLTAVDAPAANGTATVEDGQVRYVPSGVFAGTDTFTYTLDGASTPATVTVEVTGPDLAAVDDEATAESAGSEVVVDVVGNDTGSGLSVTGVTQPDAGGVTDVVDDGVRFTPEAGFRGTVTFTYTVTDVVDATATATVTVNMPNSAPVVVTPALRTIAAGGSTTFTLDASDPDVDDTELFTHADTADGSDGADDAVTTTVGVDGSGRPTVRVDVAVTFSGTADVPVTVEDGHDDGISGTTLHLRVVPRAPVGVLAGAAPNPDARAAVSKPVFDRWGWPVARQLATRIDSRITWRPSATTSVTQYVVRVDGVVVCTVAAPALASTVSCTLTDRVVRPTAVVTVTALGAAGTQAVTSVPVAGATSAPARLLAVVYFPAGRFELDKTAQKVLLSTDALAVRYGLRSVVLVGHTDWDGTDAANLRLSQRRAEQVGAWMLAHDKRVGVRTSGRGESEPAVSNKTYSGKAANRRVEIWVG